MTFAVTALVMEGETEILDADCVNISYPGFIPILPGLNVNSQEGRNGNRIVLSDPVSVTAFLSLRKAG